MDNNYTVIIATRNYGKFINETLLSVSKQTLPPKNVIVIDDGSTDNTYDILKKWQPWIEVIQLTGNGQAAAWNKGFEKVNTLWTTFLDADDYWLPDRNQRCINDAINKGADVIMHDLRVEPNKKSWVEWTSTKPLEGYGRNKLISEGVPWCFVPTSGFFVKTELLKKIMPLNENNWMICADSPILFKLAITAKFSFLDEALGIYRIHEGNNYQREDRYSSTDPRIVLEDLWLIQRIAEEVNSLLIDNGSNQRVLLINNYYYLKMITWIKGKITLSELSKIFLLQANYHKLNLRPWLREIWRILKMWTNRSRVDKKISILLSTDFPELDLRNPWIPQLGKKKSRRDC